MSQPVKSTSKLSRAMGEKLFLKGERDEGPKNALTRRPFPPGQHGQRRRGKPSDYAKQLKEKQKARYIYNLSERQMRRFFNEASRSKKNTGERLLQILEMKTDNVLYRSGYSVSRNNARQLISHGKVNLNGKKIKTPSIILKPNDELTIKNVQKESTIRKKPEMPKWIEADNKNNSVKIIAVPARDQIVSNLEEQLIVEYYSRLT